MGAYLDNVTAMLAAADRGDVQAALTAQAKCLAGRTTVVVDPDGGRILSTYWCPRELRPITTTLTAREAENLANDEQLPAGWRMDLLNAAEQLRGMA